MSKNKMVLSLAIAFISIISIFAVSAASARSAPVSVELQLESIEQLHPNSTNGDDLYFALTEYSNQHHPIQVFIPPKPNHWIVGQLPKVKNLKLWQKMVSPDEAIELVISLADQAFAPWSVDNDLGTLKVFVVNSKKDPQLNFLWAVPDQDQVVKETEENFQSTFLLKGAQALYRIKLKLVVPTLP